MGKGGSGQLIDTLQLSEEQWAQLAAILDASDPENEGGQRLHKRVSYRKLSQIAVAIQQPDKQWAKYIVRSRDLSEGGIGFVHGSFLHAGSLCRVILKDQEGQVVCIEGTVRGCDFLQGRAHNIGVQFNEEINLSRFVQPQTDESSGSLQDAG